MRTFYFFFVLFLALAWIVPRMRMKPVRKLGVVDAIVPAYNEEICILEALRRLLRNPYFNRVIVVNDGSTDATGHLLDCMAVTEPRLMVVHQANSGKGGALMNGISRSDAPYVFLSDADTFLPPNDDGLGYMIGEMERGADAVGGIPLSDLDGAGILPHIRATTKLYTIAIQRTFQQIIGGAPFLISGACGLFRRDVIAKVPFSDRTKVEDLDLTWSLIAAGYKVRQCNRAFVYSQECNSLKQEWVRWRRWIVGYAVCMRLHRSLLLSRYGLLTIIPVAMSSFVAVSILAWVLTPVVLRGDFAALPFNLFPPFWLVAVFLIAAAGGIHHRKPWLVLLAPASIIYVTICYSVWIIHGLKGLFTGREPNRDKPQRYAHVVA
jgi:cellulose synthase/poly-beta-1,6-N-acetylglucosamine synthase-like glycosyltransferase